MEEHRPGNPDHHLSRGSVIHDELQIKWHHLDTTKFTLFNGGAHVLLNFLTYPPDLLRTRMQIQSFTDHRYKQYFPIYNNTFHGFKSIITQEGIRGLYKGFLFSEIGWSTHNLIQYVGYEYFKDKAQQILPHHNKTNVFISTFLAGAVASTIGLLVSVPTEIVQQRLQLQGNNPIYKGGLDAIRKIYRAQGIKGLFIGSGATVIRDIFTMSFWWGSYEVSKYFLHDYNLRKTLKVKERKEEFFHGKEDVENEDPLIQVFSGIFASIIITLVANPIDVVKTRLQTQELVLTNNIKTGTTMSILEDLIRKEGFRALMKGFTPSLLINVPSAVVGILIYEYAKKFSLKDEYRNMERKRD